MKQQKLLSLIRQAIQDYNMIEEGDRIAVPNDAPEIMNLLKELWATGCTQKVAEGVLVENKNCSR